MAVRPLDCYTFDQNIAANYSKDNLLSTVLIAGVDEVGRGPLAGPVVAAAVILPSSSEIYGLRDSKVVPLEEREALYCEIQEEALAIEVAIVEPVQIDQLNILEASLLAMRLCVQALTVKPHLVIVDGNKKPGTGLPELAIIKGDGLSASIMAASIIAKITRDQIMREAHEQYPMYGFDEHKGYSVEKHLEALRKHGPCPLHRRSFEPVRSAACPT